MRIISGIAKSRRLHTLKGRAVRPTADRVRESIFNIIGPSVVGAKVLDLFAGFGALGLEALSRGAKTATFVEKSRPAVQIIKTNLGRLGFERSRVFSTDVFRSLNLFSRKGERFNLIFADPPYRIFEEAWIKDLWNGISNLLEEGGFFVLEHPAKWEAPSRILNFERHDSRKYGQTQISLYSCRVRP